MELTIVRAGFSLMLLLLFSELSASSFRRLSPFLEAYTRYMKPDLENPKGWEKLALLSWAIAGTIPLLSFCLSCIFFLNPHIHSTKNFVLGAVLGSNILALGLFFGLILFSSQLTFFRIRTMTSPIFLFLSTIAFLFTCLDGKITVFEGVSLWVLAIGYALYFRAFSSEWKYYQRHSNDAATDIAGGLLSVVSILCMGCGFFLCAIVAAYPFIAWMAVFGRQHHFSSLILGVNVFAIILSLPLLVRVLFTLKSTDTLKAMSISGITHSCLLNILFLPGILAFFTPLEINAGMFWVDLPVLLVFTCFYVSTLLIEKQEGRALPTFIILAYILYLAAGALR